MSLSRKTSWNMTSWRKSQLFATNLRCYKRFL